MKRIPIKRILVPVDLDHVSTEILNLVIAMSRRHNADIRLLHVIDPRHYPIVAGESLVLSFPPEDVLETETQQLQQWANTMLGNSSVNYSVECRIGAIATRIAEAAADFKANLIVMGTHGASGLLQYVMGSEAYHVINKAPCPVLTVPQQANIGSFKEILFPIRPVPGTVDKYELARAIAHKNNAHVTVLGLADELDADSGKAININMALLSKQLLDDAIEASSLLSQTHSAVQAVLQQAEEHNADLIIITADRTTNIRHLFVGPFFKQIISLANRPVLCIKPAVADQATQRATRPAHATLNELGFSFMPVGSQRAALDDNFI